ncbi:MAG TPA: hypothetical protein VMW48_07415, partial [Vicinamibacterales bacterium]|nr:hypothetical protein [Vicinamibacterales bacterium]
MRLPPVSSTRAVTWLSAGIALSMIAQQVASKAVRDGLFLTQFEVTALPTAAAAAAAVSLVAALLLGRFIAAFSPAVAVPALFGVNGLLFLVEAALSNAMPRGVAVGVYVHTAALGAAVVSGFWSVINERFDPYTARQVMGRIATGATLGGLVGGVSTWLLADVTPTTLLTILGAGNWACGLALLGVARGLARRDEAKTSPGLFDGVAVLRDFGYPRLLAVLVLLCALMSAVVDYVFKAGASNSGSSLVGFFGLFYAGTGILSFAVQSGASGRILRAFGVVAALAVLPALALAGITAALLVPSLAVLVMLRGGLMVVENSVYRSAYELLYTSVPAAQKRSGKMLIDLGSDRVGTALGSGLAVVCLAVAASSANTLLLVIGLVTAAAIGAVIMRLRRQYMGSLAASLRRLQAPVAADGAEALTYPIGDVADRIPWQGDAAGRTRAAGATASAPDRASLVAAVRIRAAEKLAAAAPPPTPVRPMPAQVSARLLDTPVAAQLAAASPGSAAWHELTSSAAAMVGQLGDIALSARYP